ncbi:hypothetical protein ASZ78_004994 [Callipepla squamata]|uniref:Period circadian protein homolog PER 1-3 bHLH-like domain-containing protein n=1 Tax=Callipepla squamata TaxID=9009 RepID=A0A226MWG2_CALSU|nr:hypothetical protein ASZ78_004994 [Callipepla squamata]
MDGGGAGPSAGSGSDGGTECGGTECGEPGGRFSGQPGCGQAHRDLMVMIREIKKCLPEEKRSSGKPRTVSALNYALRCVQQVRGERG